MVALHTGRDRPGYEPLHDVHRTLDRARVDRLVVTQARAWDHDQLVVQSLSSSSRPVRLAVRHAVHDLAPSARRRFDLHDLPDESGGRT